MLLSITGCKCIILQYGFISPKKSSQIINYLIDKEQDLHKREVWQKLACEIVQLRQGGHDEERMLIESVRNGVYDEMRSVIWPLLTNSTIFPYEKYLGKMENKEINLDLERTFPNNKNAKALGDKMKKVLNAIAVAIPELGYCQGMNFIVGTILLKLDEEQAFKMAFHIFHWEKHELLLKNLDIIHQKLYVLDKLIRKHYPKLWSTFKQYEIEPLIYGSSWFITLYCNSLPMCYVFRILECYLLEGEKILYRVALQILKIKKKIIKKMNLIEDIVEELKNYDEFNEAEADKFFKEMFEISLSSQEINSYRKKFVEETKKEEVTLYFNHSQSNTNNNTQSNTNNNTQSNTKNNSQSNTNNHSQSNTK